MRLSTLLPIAFLAVVACEGDVGPTGPEGPAGNANVVSGNFTVAANAWENDFWYLPVAGGGTQANPAKVTTVNVPAITAGIASSGAVLVYVRIPASQTAAPSQWALLPFHQGGFAGGYLVSIKFAVQAGQIRLGYVHESTDAASAPPSVWDTALPAFEFRYVAIAGAPTAAVAAYSRLNGPDEVLSALRRDGLY